MFLPSRSIISAGMEVLIDPRGLYLAMLAMLLLVSPPARADRIEISLEGKWAVEDGVSTESLPAKYTHTVAVPGLTDQARPAFPDVNHYETRDFTWTMVQRGVLPAEQICEGFGRTRQQRNFFWYMKTFTPPARKQTATLVVNKAQFGTAVWLNGKKVGEHLGCFTAGRFDLGPAMNWQGGNTLVIRIGAHPGVMPRWAPWGTDGEKEFWTPGIYDRVSVILADPPTIDSIQVAPRIATSEIVIQTRLKNPGPACDSELVQQVRTWKENRAVGEPVRFKVRLAAGEEKVLTQTVPVPQAVLWSPDNPFLYLLETRTGGDSASTRFGMRELRFDPSTRKAYLNGKVCYLRGASITLHRFFADPLCKSHPWDEAWVRKFLTEIPRRMHWNTFRICIGPAPQQWLDIADEAGILLQYEFPIWSDRDPWHFKYWREEEVTVQMKEFMRDNWNHPSLVLWDASNETRWSFLEDKLIPAVRGLDLSNRPWENGYNAPRDPGDPYEIHPYQFSRYSYGKPPYFTMPDLERRTGGEAKPKMNHAAIINEYEWLWLHRDGTPTVLTRPVYEHLDLLGPRHTAEERFEQYAYWLGGLTEYWRAYRNFAGVLYLAYLDGDVPHAFTCDNFRNPETLELEPHFADYAREAFKPLGVYINFWQPTLPAGHKQTYRVMMVNDTQDAARGKLELAWQRADGTPDGPRVEAPYAIAPAGQAALDLELGAPAAPGHYVLIAKAFWDGRPWSPTIARRKVQLSAAQHLP